MPGHEVNPQLQCAGGGTGLVMPAVLVCRSAASQELWVLYAMVTESLAGACCQVLVVLTEKEWQPCTGLCESHKTGGRQGSVAQVRSSRLFL